MISTNGVLGTMRKKGEPQFVKFYITNPDIIYATTFPLPRLAAGIFPFALWLIFQEIYWEELEIIEYGKPSKNTFNYAERQIWKLYPGVEWFYMIGDNPSGDIRGANLVGWNSILVRTGVFWEGENDINDPAKYVVNNFTDAIKLIMKQEHI